jgi:hypothetical protein
MMIRDWFPAPLKPTVRTLTNLGERTLARLAHGIVAVTLLFNGSFRRFEGPSLTTSRRRNSSKKRRSESALPPNGDSTSCTSER